MSAFHPMDDQILSIMKIISKRTHSLPTCFGRDIFFYIFSRLCKTFKKESIQLQPSEFLLKKEEGFLELLGAVFLSGRIRISWENVLRVKCPGSD